MGKKSPKSASPKSPEKPAKPVEADHSKEGQVSPEREAKKSEPSKLQTEQTKAQSQTTQEQQEEQQQEEQKKKIKLAALCEVLHKNLLAKFDKKWGSAQWGYIEGAADASGDDKNLPKGSKREKDDGKFKQYPGLKKDIETDADNIKDADKKVHPEFGRMISFKARVEWEDKGEKTSIAGKKVYWGYERTYNTEKKAIADRKPDDKESFTGLTGPDAPDNGSAKTVQWFGPVSVDEKGWTDSVAFNVSSVEGDQFKIYAQADIDDSGKPGGEKKETKVYVVGLLRIKIEELCEVVPKETMKPYYKKKGQEAQTPDWGCIEGAADKSKDKKMSCEGKRENEDSEKSYRQYINLANNIDVDALHPEYGRTLQFKCKVAWEIEKYKNIPLTDKDVYWGYSYEYPDRPKNQNKIKGSYKDLKNKNKEVELNVPKILDDTEKEKLDGPAGPVYFGDETADKNDKKKIKQWFGPVKTDKAGWTKDAVTFVFSMYAGDRFKLYIKADVDDSGKPGGEPRETKEYEVWRKFWYQQSHYSAFTSLPNLSDAEKAYKKAKACMLKSSLLEKKSYTDANLTTKGVKDITVYEKQQFKFDGSTSKAVVIGTGNESKIREFLNDGVTDANKPKEPVKSHIMYCDYQCDYETGPSKLYMQFSSKKISYQDINKYTGGFVLNPPVKDGQDVFKNDFEWGIATLKKSKVILKKLLFKSNKSIAESTPATNCTKVGGIGDVTCGKTSFEITNIPDAYKSYFDSSGNLKKADVAVYVEATVNYANQYLGDSDGHHVIIVVESSNDAETCATVSHEIGHSFNQTPRPANKPASLPAHPMGHSDAGYHCYYNAREFNKKGGGTSYKSGTCVMAQNSGNSTAEYCPICGPYIKLQDMSAMKTPSR